MTRNNGHVTESWTTSRTNRVLSKNEFFAEDYQSVGEGRHVHEKARALRAHHEEHEERYPHERGAGFAAAIQDQIRTAKHQFGGQQGATMDRQVSRSQFSR